MKRVIVNDKYTYETNLPVKVGSEVELPGTWVSGKPWIGTVTALESEYDGLCSLIIRIVPKKRSRKKQLAN